MDLQQIQNTINQLQRELDLLKDQEKINSLKKGQKKVHMICDWPSNCDTSFSSELEKALSEGWEISYLNSELYTYERYGKKQTGWALVAVLVKEEVT